MRTSPSAGTTAEILAELSRYLDDAPPAISLPPAAFSSPELYELERTRIFGRSWVLVAHRDQLAEPGDYLSLDMAGEPVLITRDRQGVLRGMSPICRHRMMPVVEPGAGRTDVFTCPQHLWRYGLDGHLVGATFMRGNDAFDPKSCRMPAFAVEESQGFVYVNLDPRAEPLAPHLGEIAADLANYQLDKMVQVGSWVEEWHANWKIVVENAHENYHVMGFHPDTLQPSAPGGTDTFARAHTPWATSLQVPLKEPLEPEGVALSEAEKQRMYCFFVFPSGSLAACGDQVIWLSFIPLAINRTQVRGGILMPSSLVEGADREALREGTESYAAVINGEDRRGLEAVQRSVGSRFAGRGHLSPKEPAVLLFYRNLARALLSDGDA
ncbi:aromatic ring-hydroxylating dioxygenase subunit alpha [Streptomyces sp. NPDC020801]|uniref:aromatic ring-hydroxylating oxygenase subunit alpha n=1 Tax=unclassified Streptomyces TaxID=2593676 RepID=UPI0037ABE13F